MKKTKKLYQSLNLNINEKYFQITDFSLDIDDNIHRDYKEYQFQGYTIKRSMITSYHDDFEKHYSDYVLEITNQDINLLIWCDYESKTTFVFYNGQEFVFLYFTTSTNLILKYLAKEKVLS